MSERLEEIKQANYEDAIRENLDACDFRQLLDWVVDGDLITREELIEILMQHQECIPDEYKEV